MISLIGLLEASVSGGICIILFFLVSQLCGERYPAKYKKVIWLLIALRLCIPVGFSLVPQPVTIQVPVYVLEGKEESQGVNNKSDLLADGAAIVREGAEDENLTTKEGNLSGNTTATVKLGGQLTSQSILTALWGFGCVVVMLHYLLSYFIFYRKMMKRSESCTNKNILVLTIKISNELGLKKIPEVRLIADEQEGPFTVGFFRNIIVLPNADYHERDLKFIIRHELIHCVSRDTQLKMLFMIVNAIHWFNPLVWLMRMLVDQDMELECDEKVLYAASKEDRSEYSEVLMSCISTSKVSRSTLSTGYVYNVKFIKKRFNYIFYSQKRIGKIVAAIIVVLLVVTSGLIGFEAGRTVYAESRIEPTSADTEIIVSDETSAVAESIAPDMAEPTETTEPTETNEPVSADSLEIKSIMNTFAAAYFEGDTDTIQQYLVDAYEWDVDVYDAPDSADEVQINALKGIADDLAGNVGDECVASLEFLNPGEDSYTYLTVEFVKEESGWKIRYYGLEK
ncbi:MAG: hypothetical protein J1F41_10115 [Lachnospiraceae bacterium]|nr:hypothetical protein [Lachnospiraceae bacterium]